MNLKAIADKSTLISLFHGGKSETVIMATGAIGLLIVGFAYYSYFYLAWISLGEGKKEP